MKQLEVLLEFKEWLTFRVKRFISIGLVIMGIFSAGLFFLPIMLRLVYAAVFTTLTFVPVLTTVQMVTGSVIMQVRLLLYNRKHKPRVEIWPEVKEMANKMRIKHNGEIYFTLNPLVRGPFVNLYTKKITVPESWFAKFHRSEIVAAIGHELGHIRGAKRLAYEMLLVTVTPIVFSFVFTLVAVLLGLPVIPIFLQVTTFTLMLLLLSFVLWRNEYRADLYGALVTGPEPLIAVFEALQEDVNVHKKDEGTDTHPPTRARIKRLMTLMV